MANDAPAGGTAKKPRLDKHKGVIGINHEYVPALSGKDAKEENARLRASKPPVRYSPEIAAEICRRIAEGETLRAICSEDGMPSSPAFLDWVEADRDGLASRYTHARERLMDHWAEQIVTIADDSQAEPNDRRVRIETRKWLMSKLAYRKYGDKLIHSGDPDNPIQHMHKVALPSTLTAEELQALDLFTRTRLVITDAEYEVVEDKED